MLLEYVKDMPKVGTKLKVQINAILSTLLFTWIVEVIFPVSMRRPSVLKFSKWIK